MKNFTINQKNTQAEGDRKLVSYQFAGGVSAVLVVYSVLLTIFFCINSIVVAAKLISTGNTQLSLWLVISILLVYLGLAGSIAAAVVRIKICNRYCNKGFELYSDKIVFTSFRHKHIEQRNIALYVILSCFIPFFSIYWLWLQVKNTKAMEDNFSNYYGELPLLVFVPIYSYVWFFKKGNMINRELKNLGYTSASNGAAFLILSLFGLSFIALAIMQRDFNNIPEDIFVKERREEHEDSFSLADVNKIYIDNSRSLYVETKDETRTIPLTSRDFRNHLNALLKSNAA